MTLVARDSTPASAPGNPGIDCMSNPVCAEWVRANAQPRDEPAWYPYRGVALLALIVVIAVLAVRWWRRRPRLITAESRTLAALVVMWVFAVQSWGYIADWEGHFTSEQFFALNAFPPIGAVLSLWLWKWARRGRH